MYTFVLQAIHRAAAFLISRQARDGSWCDYAGIPIGPSGGWVTAYVGRALAEAPIRARVHGATAAAVRAAQWLRQGRPNTPGFGYNAESGPDADSTAHALALFQALDLPLDQADVDWLLGQWRPNGGCATYARQDSWGIAHIDVTPVAFLSLPSGLQRSLRARFLEFCLTCRTPDGTWPAFWWRSHHYSTYWNRRALVALGAGPLAGPARKEKPDRMGSAFELAFALGDAVLSGRPSRRLTRSLLAAQRPNGSWPGAPNLRVTSPDCFRPWESPPGGALYTDHEHLLTTASVLSVLARHSGSYNRTS